MKILFVENHEAFAATVTRQLLSGHSITLVPSMESARQSLRDNIFDVLLVDYDLDDGKGDVLVREVRSARSCPVIIGVSSHEPGNAALWRAGASAICSKMDFDQIQTVIDAALRRNS